MPIDTVKNEKALFDTWYKEQKEMNPYIMRDYFLQRLTTAYNKGVEVGRVEERKRLLNLPRKFWEDEDHAVGGYISKKDLKEALTPLLEEVSL
jgi:hypothetical protein